MRRGPCAQFPASTEPRSFERGDPCWESVKAPDVLRLQRSRALSSAEMACARTISACSVSLQRSRALSSAEIISKLRHHRSHRQASTEPRSFERGDMLPIPEGGTGSPGFNGAALFRARRYPPHAAYNHRSNTASTEPRSFERGDSGRAAPAPASRLLLQRSRALSSAEISNSCLVSPVQGMLQRSRALSSAEMR